MCVACLAPIIKQGRFWLDLAWVRVGAKDWPITAADTIYEA